MAPVVELADDDGKLVPVRLAVWRARVGRVSLYLIDTHVEGNPEWAVTDTLYGGDRANRLRQEVLLGVGGVRVLRRLGLEPTVFHLNEGHSAFLQLERMRELVEEQGLSADEALERLRASTVFTTHTPVPAGNEVFDPELVRQALGGLVERCGLAWEDFLALGKVEPERNGLRPHTVRAPHVAVRERRLGAPRRRLARDVARTVARAARRPGPDHLGHERRPPADVDLRRARSPARRHGSAVRARARAAGGGPVGCAPHARRSGCSSSSSRRRGARELDPDVLTIGFARRFATYKRASLLFSRPERLARLLADSERPIQVLVAGKAHPADEAGKDLIQLVVDFAREPTAAGRVVFLEDYEMTLARRLVQGVDVWLNTPRRPFEASGTSGMKAALNGVLNCSILDGWWAEAYSPAVGFAIDGLGARRPRQSRTRRTRRRSTRVLEEQVLPAYYERDEAGLPQRWIALMRESIAELGPRFGTARMAAEYVERLYLPAHEGAPQPEEPRRVAVRPARGRSFLLLGSREMNERSAKTTSSSSYATRSTSCPTTSAA